LVVRSLWQKGYGVSAASMARESSRLFGWEAKGPSPVGPLGHRKEPVRALDWYCAGQQQTGAVGMT
jgi:hypothetical protein